jgi:hypothetical protein
MGEFACVTCGKAFPNRGLLGNHQKRGKCEQGKLPDLPPPPPEKPVEPKYSGLQVAERKLEDVCHAIQNEGLDLETACSAVRADVRFYYDALRKQTTQDDTITDEEREAAARVRQAEAVFERELMRKIAEGKTREEIASAQALLQAYNSRVKRRPLQFEYNSMILLDVVRRRCDTATYKLILGDLCEIDPELSVQALDPKLINRG